MEKWRGTEDAVLVLAFNSGFSPTPHECALSIMLFIQTPLKSLERLIKRTIQGKKYLTAYGKTVGVLSTRVLSKIMRDDITYYRWNDTNIKI